MIYSLRAELKAQLSKENLSAVLTQGAMNGYQFYEFGNEEEFNSIKDAAEALLKPNVYDAIGIMVKKNDFDLVISIDSTSESFGFLLGGFDFDRIGVAEATKDFIQFIKGFAILNIHTFYD